MKLNKKFYTILGIITLLVLGAGIYFLFIYQPVIEGVDNVLSTNHNQRLQTGFNTSILQDERFLKLQPYGPSEIMIDARGKDNPFVAF